MARFYGRPFEEQLRVEYHWTLAALYALEEVERIEEYLHERRALDSAMLTNHAVAPGAALDRDIQRFNQRLRTSPDRTGGPAEGMTEDQIRRFVEATNRPPANGREPNRVVFGRTRRKPVS